MPTYEYRCPKGHQFELFQRMSDEPTANCPTCGAASERLLSAGAGFLFKGGGFYITDYRSESYQKAAKAEGKEGGATKGGDRGATKGGDKGGDAGSSPSTAKEGSSSSAPKSDD